MRAPVGASGDGEKPQLSVRELIERVPLPEERIFIEIMTSDRKLQAFREGSK